MSEEYLRSSFVRGLSHSNPTAASRVGIEWNAPWTDSPCWLDEQSIPGQGRKVQHDVRVEPELDAGENGLAGEVKWLKHAKSEEIVRDIWKLMLSRSDYAHGAALRCYLLVGGEGDAFLNATDTLRQNVIYLNWREDSEKTTAISLTALVRKEIGITSLRKLLAWNQNRNFRRPPACLKCINCARRASWYRTVDGTKWRMGLWELSAWGGEETEIDWELRREAITGHNH